MTVAPYHIQMNQKELTKTFMTFMVISNWMKPFDLHGLFKQFSALRVKL